MPETLPADAEQQNAKDTYIADLERRVERSQKEIVTLTKLVLKADSAPQIVGIDATDGADIDDATRKSMFRIMAMSLHLTRVPFVMRLAYFQKRHQRRLVRALREAQLIDAEWYKETYPKVAESGEDPAFYFVRKGIAAGHVPHPRFMSEGAK